MTVERTQSPASLLARGAWIEILNSGRASTTTQSLLARGAWIEIYDSYRENRRHYTSLLARGAWIEISITGFYADGDGGRSSQEERGLKSDRRLALPGRYWSLLARGAWIEILSNAKDKAKELVAPRKRSVD